MSNQVTRNALNIMRFALDNSLEIVSYGLAPNPNGFCFENHGPSTEEQRRICNVFSKLLDGLSERDVASLKRMAFES